uniref:BH4_AAA_HYDROXYL_2 domain-containing protein n=2 Tax=Panagrellus redivivus TaxID=6233 RepID=A0A7E4VMF4_PANRE
MTVCFERYFSYFDIPLAAGHLLPSVRTIYDQLSHNTHYDYAENQERFDEFAACYLNAPESCYREDNFAKISSHPDEADYLVTFFTVSEYVYESQSNREVLACFREVLPELPRIQDKENVDERCRESLEILNMAISEFSTLCRPLSPVKGQLFAFIRRFVTRTALGRACPTLLTRLNKNDT